MAMFGKKYRIEWKGEMGVTKKFCTEKISQKYEGYMIRTW